MGRYHDGPVNYRDLEDVLKNLDVEIVHSLNMNAKLFEFIATKGLEEYDLSLSQFDVLCEVFFHAHRPNLSDISRALKVSKPTISGLVGRLKKKEFIELIDSQEDSRVSYIHLTKKGEEIVRCTISKYADFTHELLGSLLDEEKRIALKVLQILNKKLLDSPLMEGNP